MNTYFTKVMLGVFLLNTISLDLCIAATTAGGGCGGGATDTCAPPPSPPRYAAAIAVTPAAGSATCGGSTCAAPSPPKPSALKATSTRSTQSDGCASSGASTCSDTDASSSSSKSSEGTDDEGRLSVAPASPAPSSHHSWIQSITTAGNIITIVTDMPGLGTASVATIEQLVIHGSSMAAKARSIMNVRKTLVSHDLPGAKFEQAKKRLAPLSLLELEALQSQMQYILKHIPDITPLEQARIIIAMTGILNSKDRNPYVAQINVLLPKSIDKVETLLQVFSLPLERLILVTNQVSRFGTPDRALAPIIRTADYILTAYPRADLINVVTHSLRLVSKDMDAAYITAILEALSQVDKEKLGPLGTQVLKLMDAKKDLSAADIAGLIKAFSRTSPGQMERVRTYVANLAVERKDIPMADIPLMTRAFSALSEDKFPEIAPEIIKLVKGKKDMPIIMYALSKVGIDHLKQVVTHTNDVVIDAMSSSDISSIIGSIHKISQEHASAPGQTEHIIAQFKLLFPHIDKAKYKDIPIILYALSKVAPDHLKQVVTHTNDVVTDTMSSRDLSSIIGGIHKISQEHASAPGEIRHIVAQFKRLLPSIGKAKYSETYSLALSEIAALPMVDRQDVITNAIDLIRIQVSWSQKRWDVKDLQQELSTLRIVINQTATDLLSLKATAAAEEAIKNEAAAIVSMREKETQAAQAALKESLEPNIRRLELRISQIPAAFAAAIAPVEKRTKLIQEDLVQFVERFARAEAKAKKDSKDLEPLQKVLAEKTHLTSESIKELASMKEDLAKKSIEIEDALKAAKKDLDVKLSQAKIPLDLAQEELAERSSKANVAAAKVRQHEKVLKESTERLQKILVSIDREEHLAKTTSEAFRFKDRISAFERALNRTEKSLTYSTSPLALDPFLDRDDLPLPYGVYS